MATFASAREAAAATNGTETGIQSCCARAITTSGGFLWRISTDDAPVVGDLIRREGSVDQLNDDETLYKKHVSARQAALATGISDRTIRKYATLGTKYKYKGYKWRYSQL
jgi:hypothetical protein